MLIIKIYGNIANSNIWTSWNYKPHFCGGWDNKRCARESESALNFMGSNVERKIIIKKRKKRKREKRRIREARKSV